MIPVVVSSERLTLDSLLPSDTDAILRYCQDPEIQRWVHVPSPYTRDDAAYFTGTYTSNAASSPELTLWGIRLGRELVGLIELRHEPMRSATVGFWLGEEHRGQRIMSEALGLIVDYAFAPDGLALDRVHWECFLGNRASAVVARRNGFRFEGTMRQSAVHRGTRLDTWHASILRDDDRAPAEGWPL
jgi:RimJ/RimL family protein N-acetyltransferase